VVNDPVTLLDFFPDHIIALAAELLLQNLFYLLNHPVFKAAALKIEDMRSGLSAWLSCRALIVECTARQVRPF
jgi:hypothetical protein